MSQTLKNQKHPFPGATLHWPETMLRNSKQKKMQPLWQQWSVWITITLVSVWKSERLCVAMNRRERERERSQWQFNLVYMKWNERKQWQSEFWWNERGKVTSELYAMCQRGFGKIVHQNYYATFLSFSFLSR